MAANVRNFIEWPLKISILAAIAVGCLLTAHSSFTLDHPFIGTAVTIDLLFTLPIVYYLFVRKSPVPNITVLPVFVLAVITAWMILPADDRLLLSIVVVWGIPAVELFGLGHVGYRVFRIRRAFTAVALPGHDLTERLRIAVTREIKPAFAARAAAFELAVFIHAFTLRRRNPAGLAFTYHRTNGPVLLLLIFLSLIFLETAVFHMLLAMWIPTAAWILTAFSVYAAIQVFAHVRAISSRPITVTEDKLHFRCGIFGDSVIDLASVERAMMISQVPEDASGLLLLTPLGQLSQPNIRMLLKGEATFFGFYGMMKQFSSIAFFVDEPDRLIEVINDRS